MKYSKIKGTLASGHEKTSEAGKEILLAGGNIFDACIASAFTAPMAEPLLTSLAGGGLMVAMTKKEAKSFDFFVNYPGLNGLKDIPFDLLKVVFTGGEQDFHIGGASAAVPGNIAGLLTAHQRLGRIPLKEVLTPAIELARNGLELTSIQSMTMDLLEPLLSKSQEGVKLFYNRNNERYKTGDIFKNIDYSNYLQTLTDKTSEEKIKNYLNNEFTFLLLESLKGKTHLSKIDLTNYEVKEAPVLSQKFLNRNLLTCPNPSLGGEALIEILGNYLKRKLPTSYLDTEFIKITGEVFKSFELTHKNEFFKKGTTHISGTDELGNACSLSMTNGEGCGEFITGTGIMINNMLGEDDLCSPDPKDWLPGKRLGSMMAPTILFSKENPEDTLVLGAGGSKRIRSSLSLITLLTIGYDMSLEEAINYPRINFDGSTFQLEPGLSQQSLDTLKSIAPINIWRDKDFYFGGVHGVRGLSEAYGDPRRDGRGLTI